LCAAITVHNPIAQNEPTVAPAQVDEYCQLHQAPVTTLGPTRPIIQKQFVSDCRERDVSQHAACKDGLEAAGLNARATERSGYRTSQRIRKRVEEIFGWMKTVARMRRTRYRGVDRTQA